MTPTEINIAIAEIAGRKRDYYNDLNAMHDAEKSATLAYWELLEIVTRPGFKSPDFGRQSVANESPTQRLARVAGATSQHRAEAFLRDVGKWKE